MRNRRFYLSERWFPICIGVIIMFGNQGWADSQLGIKPHSPATAPKNLSFRSEDEKLKTVPTGFVCRSGSLTTMPEDAGVHGEDYYLHKIYKSGTVANRWMVKTDSRFVDDDGDDICGGKAVRAGRSIEERMATMNHRFSLSGTCPSSKEQYYEVTPVRCGCPDESADNYDDDADWAFVPLCEYTCDDEHRIVEENGQCTSTCKDGYRFDATEGKCLKLTVAQEVQDELSELPWGTIGIGVGALVVLKIGAGLLGR